MSKLSSPGGAMSLRDHFAAAALTGLLFNGDYSMESIPRHAFSMADAMLRERTNHDAAPAATARTDADRGRTDKADSRPGEGTGDTPVTEPMPKEKRAEVSVTLTDAEREAIEYYMAHADGEGSIEDVQVLRGLLERLK